MNAKSTQTSALKNQKKETSNRRPLKIEGVDVAFDSEGSMILSNADSHCAHDVIMNDGLLTIVQTHSNGANQRTEGTSDDENDFLHLTDALLGCGTSS